MLAKLKFSIKCIILHSAVGAAALNDKLYVCGGYNGINSLNTVECYLPEKDEWYIITSMQKHRSAGGLIAYKDHIYALGGHDGLSIFDSVCILQRNIDTILSSSHVLFDIKILIHFCFSNY